MVAFLLYLLVIGYSRFCSSHAAAEVQHPADREQISTAAGREIARDVVAVEVGEDSEERLACGVRR